jgi:hypothetical protein
VNPESELRKIALARGWPVHELRSRRKALLVGVPAGLGGAAVFGGGIALGIALEKRRAYLRKGPFGRAVERYRR